MLEILGKRDEYNAFGELDIKTLLCVCVHVCVCMHTHVFMCSAIL